MAASRPGSDPPETTPRGGAPAPRIPLPPGEALTVLLAAAPARPTLSLSAVECASLPPGAAFDFVVDDDAGGRCALSPLPFADARFARVIVDLRRVWPRGRGAAAAAAEIDRVLAPDGELLVLAGNRHGRQHFGALARAGRDAGSVFGRMVAQARTALTLVRDWRRQPHARALERFLRDARCPATRWYWPVRDGGGRLHAIRALPVSLPRILSVADEHVVRATRQRLAPSVVDACLVAAGDCLPGAVGPAVAEHLLVTAKEKAVVFARHGERRVVIRLPLTAAARAGAERNFATLTELADRPGLRARVPAALGAGTLGEGQWSYSIEGRVPGAPAAGEGPPLAQVEALLRALNPAPRGVVLAGADYHRLVRAPLRAALAGATDNVAARRLRRFVDQRLCGARVALGLRHGDCSVGNIHVREGAVCGLIDWDDSAGEAITLDDAIGHLSSRVIRRGHGFAATFAGIATQDLLAPCEREFLTRCYDHCGVEPALHPALTLLCWARVVAAQRDFAFARQPAFRAARLDALLACVSADERFAPAPR